ncbi:MAG TPA: hydrolase, partial [Candidatus Marinimicrobia bacterium]|nr:hydrolase [Candidatus Neomarinimicrobiota bacterium]
MKLTIDDTVLILIDVQTRLFPVMSGKAELLENLLKIVRGFNVLQIPVIVTQQYTKALGPTLPELAGNIHNFQPIEKRAFSCCGEGPFLDELKRIKRKQVIVGGIEAHVCVYQTCCDLLGLGYEVFLLTDAVSSRNINDKRLTIRVLGSIGVQIRSVEMALFELLKTSTHPKFK